MTENKLAKYNPQKDKVARVQNALIMAKGVRKDAARLAGVSLPTIKRYIDTGIVDPSLTLDGEDNYEALSQYSADRNAELAETMMGTAEKAIAQVDARIIDANAKDAALVAGVMIDKARLIRGQATERVEIDIRDPLGTLRRLGLVDDTVIDAEVVEETD